MPVHYMFSASAVDKLQSHYTSQKRTNDERDESDRRTTRHEAHQQQQTNYAFWPIGTRVVTVYGTGYVVGINRNTGIHEVNLGYGRGFFSIATIVGAESLSNNSLDAIGVSRNESGQETIINVKAPYDPPDERVIAPSYLLYGTQVCLPSLSL